jgi:hypothetical protein
LSGRKLLFVWHPEGPFQDPKELARIALNADVTALALKVDDGGLPFSDGSTNFGRSPERIIDYIQTMRAAGVAAGLWGYHYGTNLEAEAEMACRAMGFGADFYIVDWEAEFQRAIAESGTIVPFANYLQRIVGYRNQEAPCCGLFHAPLPQPRYWYPWMYEAFQRVFDGMLPQIYHGAMELPYYDALQRCYDDYAHYGLTDKPIWPAGQAYDLPPQEVLAWGMQAVRVYGATGLSWWKLEDAYYNGALDAIRAVSLVEDGMRRVNGLHPDYREPKVLPVGVTQVPIRSAFGLLATDTRVVLDIEVLGVPNESWPVVIVCDGSGAYAGYLDGSKTRDQIVAYMSAGPAGNISLEVQRGRAKVTLLGILEAG